MKYLISKHDWAVDDITFQSFDNYDDAYLLREELHGDGWRSEADYEDRPYYEIIERKDWWIYKQASYSYLPRPFNRINCGCAQKVFELYNESQKQSDEDMDQNGGTY